MEETKIMKFQDFCEMAAKEMSEGDNKATQDWRDLVVYNKEGKNATFGLDKMYRMYVDTVLTQPNLNTHEVLEVVRNSLENHRKKVGKKPFFQVSQVETVSGVILEQCCIR